jgi:uncharacterized membrane protein (UPF0127 family)
MFSKKLIVFFTLFCIIIAFFYFVNPKKEIKAVRVGGKDFYVEVASTNLELTRGLSLHLPLTNDQGMLFIFKKDGFYGIWMKDMLFPIDILWIDSNLKVVDVKKDVLPETYPKVFYPKTKNLYVLEIPAGQVDVLKIEIGDVVKFIKK